MSDRDMQELYKMQEEAKKRVMDMHSRSRFAAEQMNRSLNAPQEQKREPAGAPVVPFASDTLRREELERLFLLSLCLLLSQEEADRSVILALLYIVS